MTSIRVAAAVVAGAAAACIGLATPASASTLHMNKSSNGGCSTSANPAPTKYNQTPGGATWQVPFDRCNYEGKAMGDTSTPYSDNAYWAAEKRPDIFWGAVNTYGYKSAPYGAWNIEMDAKKAGYSITMTPQVGDLAAWKPNATMGQSTDGYSWYTASSGGHVAYVEAVSGNTITISETGHGGSDPYGYTYTMTYTQGGTYFIHR